MSFVILIIEDDQFEQKHLATILKREEYNLVFADDGQSGLEKALETTPDLIILDIMLPDIDGFEVCRQVRHFPTLAEVPLVMVTSLGDRQVRLQGIESGADDFISKPYDPIELRARVKSIARLNRYRHLREERNRFASLVDLSPDGIVIADDSYYVNFANPSAVSQFGIIPGMVFPDLQINGLAASLKELLKDSETLPVGAMVTDTHFEITLSSGVQTPITAEMRVQMIEWNQKNAWLVSLHDITQRKQSEEEVRELNLTLEQRVVDRTAELEETNRQLLDEVIVRKRTEKRLSAIQNAILVLNSVLEFDKILDQILEQLFRVVAFDSASIQLLENDTLVVVGLRGFQQQNDLLGLRFPISEDRPNRIVISTQRPLRINDIWINYSNYFKPPHNDQIRSWMGIPLLFQNRLIGMLALDSRRVDYFTDEDEKIAQTFAAHVSIALENSRLYAEIKQLAITDGLTGLFNRRHFFVSAEKEIERAKRYNKPLAALMFDIDHFKQVNDTYGHRAGDQTLQMVARITSGTMRKIDLCGRYGGEEFVIILPETDLECAKIAAERLRQQIEASRAYTPNGEVKITVSLGVAALEPDDTIDNLLDHADQAMYQSKQHGRNRIEVFSKFS
jgi:diguanylate cyclase (GGDEF)-like protein/PAS domain S-box-containing protein